MVLTMNDTASYGVWSSCHSESPKGLDDVTDRVQAMREQEQNGYAYQSYFPSCPSTTGNSCNVSWREKIVTWAYNVVDHFDLSREVVAISLDLFDRYLATQSNNCSGNLALLTSLTTLHIAIKLHDCKKIKLTTLASLSRGQFTFNDIVEMEWTVIAALNWRLHPPSQYSFVSNFLKFLPLDPSSSVFKDILEMAGYLTELAVCDSFFVEVENSSIAFAAILNVLGDMNYARLSAGTREKFMRELYYRVGLHPRAPAVVAARERLQAMLSSTRKGAKTPSSSATPTSSSYQAEEQRPQSTVEGRPPSHYTKPSDPYSTGATTAITPYRCHQSPSASRMMQRQHQQRRFVANVSPIAAPLRGGFALSPIEVGTQ